MCCHLSLHFVLVGLYLRLYSAVLCQCLLQATKRFLVVDLFIGRVSSVHEKILIGGSSLKKEKFWEHWSAL